MSGPPDVPRHGAPRQDFADYREGALQRRAAELEERERAIRRIWWGGLWRIMLVEWSAIGLLGWSLHTTSMTAGTMAFYGALGLGYAGFLILLVITVQKVDQVKPW